MFIVGVILLEFCLVKIVERFKELYKDDRLNVINVLKKMFDRLMVERMVFFFVEVS